MSDPVQIAVITGVVGPILLTVIGIRLRRAVGRPNGRGNVVEMLDDTLGHLERLETRTEHLVSGQADMVNSQAGQDRRIAGLERDRPPWWLQWLPIAASAALLVLTRRRSRSR